MFVLYEYMGYIQMLRFKASDCSQTKRPVFLEAKRSNRPQAVSVQVQSLINGLKRHWYGHRSPSCLEALALETLII